MPLDLAVIVPTLNEAGNIRPLVAGLERALEGVSWEVVFVDDGSDDGTLAIIEELAAARAGIRCQRRVGRRGLASACIEGMLATTARRMAVMDADLQHDERLLPRMLEAIEGNALDLVVASRYMAGGSAGELAGARRSMSRLGGLGSRLLVRDRLSDPMSGFFMIRREAFAEVAPALSGRGFKILLDIIASAPRPLKVAEIPMTFRRRLSGDSKLDALVSLEFAMLFVDKLLGRALPASVFVSLSAAAAGLGVHLLVLTLSYRLWGTGFGSAQAAATVVAMSVSHYLDTLFTYRSQRLHGALRLKALALFYLFGAAGAVAGVLLAGYLFRLDVPWLPAGLMGALVSVAWACGVNATLSRTRSVRPG